jgi:hypothetical protein
MSFYELLYQNETLYRVSESVQGELPVVEVVAIPESIKVAKIELPKPIPVPIIAVIQNPIVQPPVLAPVQPAVIASPKQHDSVLILADDLSVSERAYLDKILKAAGGMSTESVDLQIFTKGMDFRPILRSGRIKHFVSFGVPFLKVNVDLMMNRYEPKIIGGIVFVFADPLPVVEADEAIRRALWGVLKALFVKQVVIGH